MIELVCQLCPKACNLQVLPEDDYRVLGNACPRGLGFGRQVAKHSARFITARIKTNSQVRPICTAKSDQEVSLDQVDQVLAELAKLELKVPIRSGQVVAENVLGLGVNFISIRNIRS